MPAPFGRLDPDVVVADVVTAPEITPLLAHDASAIAAPTGTCPQLAIHYK